MRSAPALFFIITLCGLPGCEFEPPTTPDYGMVRVKNDSPAPVNLLVNGELKATIDPGRKKGTRMPEDLALVSIQDVSGNVLFEQLVEVPDNTFAEYVVLEGGEVFATAGNIDRPDIVGGSDEQIKLQNLAGFPVEVYANGELLAIVSAGNATIDVPNQILSISFRRANGRELFKQTVDIPKNTVIHYTVFPDGTVAATGGPIEPNTQERPTYYGPY